MPGSNFSLTAPAKAGGKTVSRQSSGDELDEDEDEGACRLRRLAARASALTRVSICLPCFASQSRAIPPRQLRSGAPPPHRNARRRSTTSPPRASVARRLPSRSLWTRKPTRATRSYRRRRRTTTWTSATSSPRRRRPPREGRRLLEQGPERRHLRRRARHRLAQTMTTAQRARRPSKRSACRPSSMLCAPSRPTSEETGLLTQ